MRHFKKIIFFLILFISCQANNDIEGKKDILSVLDNSLANHNADSTGNLNSSQTIFVNDTIFFDSLINKVEAKSKLWISEWEKIDQSFDLEKFKKDLDKVLMINWTDFDVNSVYFFPFKPMLNYTSNGERAIDIYSYNTVLEKDGDSLYAAFDIDNRVYIVDFNSKARTEILFTGSYEVIEECVWLSNNVIAILGYIAGNGYSPFIWVFDIHWEKQIRYVYAKPMNNHIESYFFKKFPHIKLRDE